MRYGKPKWVSLIITFACTFLTSKCADKPTFPESLPRPVALFCVLDPACSHQWLRLEYGVSLYADLERLGAGISGARIRLTGPDQTMDFEEQDPRLLPESERPYAEDRAGSLESPNGWYRSARVRLMPGSYHLSAKLPDARILSGSTTLYEKPTLLDSADGDSLAFADISVLSVRWNAVGEARYQCRLQLEYDVFLGRNDEGEFFPIRRKLRIFTSDTQADFDLSRHIPQDKETPLFVQCTLTLCAVDASYAQYDPHYYAPYYISQDREFIETRSDRSNIKGGLGLFSAISYSDTSVVYLDCRGPMSP